MSGAKFPPVKINRHTPHEEADNPPLPTGPFVPGQPSPPTVVHFKVRRVVRPHVARSRADALAPRSVTSPVTLLENTSLAAIANGEETSEASSGKVIFLTGNWFAALSTDRGATFTAIDPTTVFPAANAGYCCDQIVQYSPRIDRFFWLILYSPDNVVNGHNTLRLAVSSPARLAASGGVSWTYYDLRSSTLGLAKEWMDFPDLAVGASSLYLTANGFQRTAIDSAGHATDAGQGSLLVRLPLAQFASLTAHRVIGRRILGTGQDRLWDATWDFRVAQNGGSRAYWASHTSHSALRVFSWDENSTLFSWRDVTIPSWDDSDMSSVQPGGGPDWLSGSMGSTILGATARGSELWFAWTVGRDKTMTQPHIYIARLDATRFRLIEQRSIWNPDYVFAYPSLATNSQNEVGIAFAWGGNIYFPNHGVGILTNLIDLEATVIGNTPVCCWGHYDTIRRDYPATALFSAAGFAAIATTTPGGNTGDVHYILFGRSQ